MVRSLILHVEDEADDALFVGLAFKKAKVDYALHRVGDGREAIRYLAGQGEYADRSRHPLPHLILLDLKLPLLNGFEVLSWIRSQPHFHHLPVVVLSGSELEEDRAEAARLGATSYLVKTPLYPEVISAVQEVLASSDSLAFHGPPLRSRPASAQV